MMRQESKGISLKVIGILIAWFLSVSICGIFHIAHICLGMSIASMALLMSEKNWTAKSVTALTLNMVAMGLSFWLLIR
ncbi:MAG: hypothetical protein KC652_00070 [Cyanobacteria bacterium HKST-UBA01]|nr:hypothetical protein [Cyanobacteria bacterium HKST-UBA01]